MASTKKASTQIGQGMVLVIGLIFGMVLALLIWGWYLSGFSDTTTVFIMGMVIVALVLIFDWIIMIFAKRLGADYQKGFWFGIGFIIAVLVITFILSLIGLGSPITVGLVIPYILGNKILAIPYILGNKAQCGSISQ